MSSVNQIIGGSFQDSEGNLLASGYLLFELNQDGVVNTGTLICAGRVIKVPLDSSGNVVTSTTYSLWPNDVLLPSGSFYSVTAFTKNGERVWGPNPQSVLSTPSPFNISAWIPGKV